MYLVKYGLTLKLTDFKCLFCQIKRENKLTCSILSLGYTGSFAASSISGPCTLKYSILNENLRFSNFRTE